MWGLKVRIEAAGTYIVTGSFKQAAEATGVPERTIRLWASQPWWDAILDEARGVKNNELDMAWTQIIHTCIEMLKERLDKGNPKTNSKGKVYYVPCSVEQVGEILTLSLNNRKNLRGVEHKSSLAVDKVIPSGKTPEGRLKSLEELANELSMPINSTEEHEGKGVISGDISISNDEGSVEEGRDDSRSTATRSSNT